MTAIKIDFLPVHALPNATIAAKGPVSQLFLDKGVASFHEASELVHELPYGQNSASGDSTIALKEGLGTCTAKHGLIARLAEELGLDVHRCEGFYKLTDSVVAGAGRILKKYELPYIPRTHCFLSCSSGFVDLTEGNCTGKNGLIESYVEILRVKPEQSGEETDQMYRKHFAVVCANQACFARLGIDGMLEVLEECVRVNNAICQRMNTKTQLEHGR